MFRSTLSLLYLAVITGSVQAASPTDWPQFRGVDRTGLSKDTGLRKEWPEGGPPVAWQVDTVGESYSSLAVADGRVFTQGNVGDEGRILCLSQEDGSIIWSVRSPAEEKVYTHGRGNGARGTPTVDGNLVYVIGGGGDLTCLKAESGDVVWSKHLVKDLGGGRPGWGYSESPLIDGDNLIVIPGGRNGCVAALNKMTGDVVWRSEGVKDRAHYCSAIVAESNGVRQIITFTGGAGKDAPPRVVGVDAGSGDLLWWYGNSANGTASVSTPIFHNDMVFSASAYGTGGGAVRLVKGEDGFTAPEVYFEKKIQNQHGGMVLVDGYMYGTGSGALLCVSFETGEIKWQARSAGKGSLCYADGHLYCYGERNEVTLVEVNSEEYIEKGRFSVPKRGKQTWAHPVVANGKFFLRDMTNLTCYNVRAE